MDFLQSEQWRKFQESVGRKTFSIYSDELKINIIEHKLPIVGRYFYVPRLALIRNSNIKSQNDNEKCKIIFKKLINSARQNDSGWIRIDVDGENDLKLITELINELNLKIKKAPHDMQPRQTFVIDISKSEEDLLAGMKSKTRYNIRLSQKKGIKIFNFQCSIFNEFSNSNDSILNNGKKKDFYINELIRLIKITSKRQGIVSHSDEYYRKMMALPCVSLYVAEYEGKVVAAAIVSFFEDAAIYLHGASDDDYKNVMAPFALHWQVIKDAKEKGCKRYDMGGVKTKMTNDKFPMTNKYQKSKIKNQNEKCEVENAVNNNWAGITRFKVGFSPETIPVEFAGSYDIIIDSKKYYLYEIIRKVKSFM